MIFTLLFGVAPPERPDSKCWIDLKVFYFQPSELLKVGFIISFSYHLDLVKDNINKLKSIIPLVIHGAVPVGLVLNLEQYMVIEVLGILAVAEFLGQIDGVGEDMAIVHQGIVVAVAAAPPGQHHLVAVPESP